MTMTRKAFLIWGLVFIQLSVSANTLIAYLSISKIVDFKTTGLGWVDAILIFTLISFGLLLHLRFKSIGRRKRTLAFCLPFIVISGFIGGFLMLGFMMTDIFGAHDRYFNIIYEWAALSEPKSALAWTTAERLDYVLLQILPGHYIFHWGLFALLWFGSLDPRKPNTGQFSRFISRAVTKTTVRIQTPMQRTI